ncbi:hypothetical protein GJ496_000824 [Pomphorhynchus laevis]|nr:hypothetical protein GJ496_000824 [Pomphorhynchus laevis]
MRNIMRNKRKYSNELFNAMSNSVISLQIEYGGDIHPLKLSRGEGKLTVCDLQNKCQEKFHIPFQCQRLYYKGIALHTYTTEALCNFGIEDNSMIRLVGIQY